MVTWCKKNKVIKYISISIICLSGLLLLVKSGTYFLRIKKPELYTKIFFDIGNIAPSAHVKIIDNEFKELPQAGSLIDTDNNSTSQTLIGKNEVLFGWDKTITLDKVEILLTGDSTFRITLTSDGVSGLKQIGSISVGGPKVVIDFHNQNITTSKLNLSISSPKQFKINEISVFNIEPQTQVILLIRSVWSRLQPILFKLFTFFLPIILIIPLGLILSSNFRYRYLFIFPILLSIYIFFQNPPLAFRIIVLSNFISLPFIYKKKFSSDSFAFNICLLFCIYLSVLSIIKMYSFSSGWTLDFATQNNALWNFTHLNNFFRSNLVGISTENQGKFSTIFGHSSFILIPIAFIYRLLPKPETLVIIQSLGIALACYIFYLIAKYYLKDKLVSVILLLCLVLYPQLTWIGLADFRPEIFSILFLFLTFYFIPKNSLFALLSFIGAMFSSELNPLYGITISVYLFATKKKTLALVFLIVGVSYFIFFTKVLSPMLSAGEDVRMIGDQYGYFQYLINKFPITSTNNVGQLINFFGEPLKISLFLRYFNPLFGIPLFNPIFWIIGMPGVLRLLALNVHTRNFYESTLIYYFSSLILVMFFSTVLFMKFLNKNKRLFIISLLVLSTLVTFNQENSSDYGLYRDLSAFVLTDRDKLAYEANKLISPNTSLYVSQKYLVPFSSREKIYIFNGFNSNVINNGDYFLVDLLGKMRETVQDEKSYQLVDKTKIVSEYLNFNKDLLNQNNINLIFNQDGILLFKKENVPLDHKYE